MVSLSFLVVLPGVVMLFMCSQVVLLTYAELIRAFNVQDDSITQAQDKQPSMEDKTCTI
jgi:hypothetical protein